MDIDTGSLNFQLRRMFSSKLNLSSRALFIVTFFVTEKVVICQTNTDVDLPEFTEALVSLFSNQHPDIRTKIHVERFSIDMAPRHVQGMLKKHKFKEDKES